MIWQLSCRNDVVNVKTSMEERLRNKNSTIGLSCLVPRPPYFVAVEPFRVTWSERKSEARLFSALCVGYVCTSLKWIDREGLEKSRTGTGQYCFHSRNKCLGIPARESFDVGVRQLFLSRKIECP